jgi:hypothetical protein
MKNQRNKLILYTCCLFFSCTPKEEPLSWLHPPDYYSIVKLNSNGIICGIHASEYSDSLVSMSFSYFTDDAIYRSLKVGHFLQKSQNVTLQKYVVGVGNTYCIYYGSCCVPEADVVYFTYNLLEEDSVHNILSV